MYILLRSLLFMFAPEAVHYFSMNCLRTFSNIPAFKNLMTIAFFPEPEPIELFGLKFNHRIGLAAGFDKNAAYLNELHTMGFGHVEIGTVTPLPQAGNPKPRLYRLRKDQALLNRMGFNNEGVEKIAKRLQKWRNSISADEKDLMIVGGNIGKNKITANEDAWKDYAICFETLHPFVDYFVVNVSSPNTPGLRELQEKTALHKILTHLQVLNHQKPVQKPILLKIAPDLSWEQIDDVISLAKEINLDGIVCSNTSLDRNTLSDSGARRAEKFGAGGLSGAPIKKRNTELVQYISQKSNGRIPIIASGGIFNGADAEEKLQAGASLVQVWTGFIYRGPGIAKQILKERKTMNVPA